MYSVHPYSRSIFATLECPCFTAWNKGVFPSASRPFPTCFPCDSSSALATQYLPYVAAMHIASRRSSMVTSGAYVLNDSMSLANTLSKKHSECVGRCTLSGDGVAACDEPNIRNIVHATKYKEYPVCDIQGSLRMWPATLGSRNAQYLNSVCFTLERSLDKL